MTMTTTVYVIRGTTGEYSDRQEWLVCAYQDEQLAKDHVLAATRWAHEEHARIGRYGDSDRPSPYDPDIVIYYTGTAYRYDAVLVRDALPQEAPTQK